VLHTSHPEKAAVEAVVDWRRPVCINAESLGASESKLPFLECEGDCIIKLDGFWNCFFAATASAIWDGDGACVAPRRLTRGEDGAEYDLTCDDADGSLGADVEKEVCANVELGTDRDVLTPTPFFPPRFRGDPSAFVRFCFRLCLGEPFGELPALLLPPPPPLPPFFFLRRCFGEDGIAPWPAIRLIGEFRVDFANKSAAEPPPTPTDFNDTLINPSRLSRSPLLPPPVVLDPSKMYSPAASLSSVLLEDMLRRCM